MTTLIEITYQDESTEALSVTSAAYGDATETSIVLDTVERGRICVTPDTAEVWTTVLAAIDVTPYSMPAEMVTYAYERAVQSHLDELARTQGYDNIMTAVSYADEPAVAKFQQEGAAFRAWRSNVWAYVYAQLAAVQAAEREQPTPAQLVAELPTLLLPTVE